MLVVEDGSVVPGANCYVDVEFADEYISTFYPEDFSWETSSEEVKEAAIINAAKFLDRLLRWSSRIKSQDQLTAFPRITFYDSEGRIVSQDSVPQIIKNANVELALESLTHPLNDEFVYIKQESLGSTSDTYDRAVRVGGSDVIFKVKEELLYYGFGRNNTSVVIFERA